MTEAVSEVKERSIEIIQYKTERKGIIKVSTTSGTCRTLSKDLTFMSLASQKRRNRVMQEKYLNKYRLKISIYGKIDSFKKLTNPKLDNLKEIHI